MDKKRLLELAGVDSTQINEEAIHLQTYFAVYDRSTNSFIHLLDGKHLTGAWSNGKPLPLPQRSGLKRDFESAKAMMDKALTLEIGDTTYENFDPVVVEIKMSAVA